MLRPQIPMRNFLGAVRNCNKVASFKKRNKGKFHNLFFLWYQKILCQLKHWSFFQSTSAGTASSSGLGFLHNWRRGRGTATIKKKKGKNVYIVAEMKLVCVGILFVRLVTFYLAVKLILPENVANFQSNLFRAKVWLSEWNILKHFTRKVAKILQKPQIQNRFSRFFVPGFVITLIC